MMFVDGGGLDLARPDLIGRRVGRRFVLAGLVAAPVLALVVLWPSSVVERECRGGAFSGGFSQGFDTASCDAKR
jgi:hypothetical protein